MPRNPTLQARATYMFNAASTLTRIMPDATVALASMVVLKMPLKYSTMNVKLHGTTCG